MTAMLAACPTLIVVHHVDAGDRTRWTEDQDLRPISELGHQQAEALAAGVGTVDAVFSSPARRCTETVARIAAASGVDIVEMDDLRELTYVVEHRAWDWWTNPPMSDFVLAVTGIGRIMRAVTSIAQQVPAGRVAVCAHGDLVPLFAAFAATTLAVPFPDLTARGGWFEVEFTGPTPGVRGRGALAKRP